MTSLEIDQKEYRRATYNCPYKCINIQNISSTEYLSDLFLPDDEHNIFWLDFVSPGELGAQLADYARLLNLLNPHDIVRITLNANPDALGRCSEPDELQAYRLTQLKSRVPENYISPATMPEDMVHKNYPLTLLKILKAYTLESLIDNPPYSPNFMFPLFSSVYADQQQMLIFTGIVLNNHKEEDSIKKALLNYPHNNFSWDRPCKISIPPLTIREITELNKLLPDSNIEQRIVETLPFVFSANDMDAVKSYAAYYKFYPNFHQVNF